MPDEPELAIEVVDARDVVMALFIREHDDGGIYADIKGMRISKRVAAGALAKIAKRLYEQAKAEGDA